MVSVPHAHYDRKRVTTKFLAALALSVVIAVSSSSGAGGGSPPTLLCKLPSGADKLPATARHGLIQHLPQYPAVRLATPGQRLRARRVLRRLVSAAEQGDWRNVRTAERAGYDTDEGAGAQGGIESSALRASRENSS